MSTATEIVISGRNTAGHAFQEAERQLRSLNRQGELLGKLFRGGAIVGAIVAFERLAENAEAAAIAIGDEGTAKALGLLNRKIDELKSKGVNIIGKVLGGFATYALGSDADKAAQALQGVDQRIGQIKASVGPNGILGPGLQQDLVRLEQERAKLQSVIALAGTFNDRRLSAVTRGGGSGVLTSYSSAFDAPAAKGGGAMRAEFSMTAAETAQMEAYAKIGTDYWESVAFNAGVAVELEKSSAKALDDIAGQMEATYNQAAQQNDQMSAFAEQAARNMQDSFAQFLFDPFKEGLNGMLAGFIDTIRRMVAEAAASELLQAFFSWGSGFGGGVGSFFSSMSSSIGKRAAGGPVGAGMPYMVGERGPELFVPSTNGSILANGAGGVALTYHIDARGADADRIMAMLPPLLKQTSDQTVARIRDLNGRGRL